MKITTRKRQLEEINTKAIVIILKKRELLDKTLKTLDKKLQGRLSEALKEDLLEQGKFTQFFTGKKIKAEQIVIAGLKDNILKLGGELARYLQSRNIDEFTVYRQFDSGEAKTLAEGILLGGYQYSEFKKVQNNVDKFAIFCNTNEEDDRIAKELNEAGILYEAVKLARDLTNRPAINATPENLAKEARKVAKLPKVTVRVLDKNALKKEKMNLHLGVSAGSFEKPRFVILHYKGSEKKPTILIGKGVTFDSGGSNLKPSQYMVGMHGDMGGAATVLATIQAVAKLKLKVNIYGLIPLTENIIGGRAIKPGDIIKSRSGKTVEIANTDAEGRLILADALDYAQKYSPKEVIDIATLTGASIIALGHEIAPIMGTDEKFNNDLIDAGKKVSELLWPLPLLEEYKEHIKSDVADIKNIGNPQGEAGCISAGLFLQEFVKSPKWAHIDIGGATESKSTKGHTPKGFIGFGVRLFVEYLKN